jgi:ketosteroid isomerase-like protein
MSQENVEIVRKAIEAGNRRDLAMARALWRSDAEVDWSRSQGPLKGVYRGREQVENFQNEFWSTFEKVELEAHGFTQAGSDVVVPNTAHLRGREGIEVIARATLVFTVEDGQITRLRMFQERAEALEAVCLSEWRRPHPSTSKVGPS